MFAGIVKVHQNTDGDVLVANGDFFRIPDKLSTKATIDRQTAERTARASFTGADSTIWLSGYARRPALKENTLTS